MGHFYDDVSEYNPTTRIGYFPSCPRPLLQNEAECKAIDKKMILYFLDCEQSLFFFRFSKGSARARERSAAKPRDVRNENVSPCLSPLAPSVTRVVICVSRAFCSTDQEKRETARSLFILTQI